MSNDRRQIELERALRKVGYLYLRKRENKGESRVAVGKGQFYMVTKEELAQAVAGCDLDPHIIRSGREKLFGEDLYHLVFPNSDPFYFIPRYRLLREVTWASKGKPERGYAKWLVLNFIWSNISPLVRAKSKCRAFCKRCEKQHADLVVPINRMIEAVFVEAVKYWREHRGIGETAQDVSTFFRSRKNLHKQFADHWNSISDTRRAQFDKDRAKVEASIGSLGE